jgi:hypothetical protein
MCEKITKQDLWNWFHKWKDENVQEVEDKSVFKIDLDEVFPFKKRKRSRRNSLRGSASLEYYSFGRGRRKFKRRKPEEYVDGKVKWDMLVESLKKNGWVAERPMIIRLSKNNKRPLLRDGHHRLYAARETEITEGYIEIWYV